MDFIIGQQQEWLTVYCNPQFPLSLKTWKQSHTQYGHRGRRSQSVGSLPAGDSNPMVDCQYFPPGYFASYTASSQFWPVPNYTVWWQRHICVNNLPRVIRRNWNSRKLNPRHLHWVTTWDVIKFTTWRLLTVAFTTIVVLAWFHVQDIWSHYLKKISICSSELSHNRAPTHSPGGPLAKGIETVLQCTASQMPSNAHSTVPQYCWLTSARTM